MTSNVLALIENFDSGMTDFQINTFVLDEQLTPFRIVRQAIIELKSRVENKANLELDLEETAIKIEQEQDLSQHLTGFELRLSVIKLKRLQYEKDRQEAMIQQIDRECKTIADKAESVILKNYGSVEAFQQVLADPKTLLGEEQKYWSERFKRGAFADLVNFGTVSKGLLEAILLLDDDAGTSVLTSAIQSSVKLSSVLNTAKSKALSLTDK